MRILIRVSSFFIGFSVFLLAALTSAHAVTRYVNSDSNGSASNPTRAFNDPSYTANDSYQTLTAAYTAASSGDIIEFSGGTTGKTYLGMTSSLQKTNVVYRGSTISNHNGMVTIDYNSGGGLYTMGANANGMSIENLTISRQGGLSTQYALRVFLDNVTIRNVTIKDTAGFGLSVESTADNTLFENLRVDTSTIAGANAMQGFNGFTMRNAIFSGTDLTGIGGISFQSSATPYTLDNVVFDGISSGSVLPAAGATVNLTNCVITASGFNTQRSIYGTGGTVNTSNCFIQGPLKIPDIIASGGVTWNSSNDIIGEYSYYTRTKENTGYILFGIDDRHNLDHFKAIADYAKTNYGMTMSFYVHDTVNLTTTDKTKIQQLHLDGHEIALHSRHHTNMGVAGPMSITYTGAAVNIAFVVSNNGTSLSLTGSADTQGPIDLTAAANDTVGELCTTIEGWVNYTCTLTGTVDSPTRTNVRSIAFKDASTNLPQNIATIPIYDDNTGPSNRFLSDEITTAINELEAAMHENPLTSSYAVQSFAYPYSSKAQWVSDWIVANTNLESIRAVGSDSLAQRSWLGNINIFIISNAFSTDNIRGTGYDALDAAGKEARIKRAARAIVTYASIGMVTGYVGHNETQDLTIQELSWLVDEIALYSSVANVEVVSQIKAVDDIKDSGDWINAGSGTYTRTFSGSANYQPRYQSQMIDGGITTSGRTTDIAGASLVGNPDMGAYEFQLASNPSSLNQYKSDGTTAIVSGAWTNESTVVFKFTMSSSNTVDELTPKIELRNTGVGFSNTSTHTGSPVVYSGTPVTGTVTVTGLTTEQQYHWQALITNTTGDSSWVSFGSDPNFGIDITAPTTPGTPSTTTPTSDTTPTWTWTASTDAASGLANPAYTVEWSQASDFGSGISSSTTNTNNFTHSSTLAAGTWYFRVRATDTLSNVSANSSSGSVAIDSTAPTTPGTPSTTTPTSDTTPAWTWTASTDAIGLANPAYTVEWSLASDFGSGINSSTTNTNNFTHSSTLAAGTWYFRVRASDLAGNQSSYSSNGSVVIDLTGPTTPGTPSPTTPSSDNTPNWTWTASTDSSGLANPAYTVEWSQASDFGSGVSSSTTNTNSFTHSVILANGTWYFRVRATDAVNNVSANSSNGSITISIVDITDPTTPGTPTTTSPTTDTTPSWTWTASTDLESGLANPAYTVEWSQAADFGSGINSSTTNTNSFTHSTALADGTWYFRVRATDASSNVSNNSSNGSVSIDSTPTNISLINVSSVSASSATITWSTNENSSSRVEYGITTSYGSQTPETNTSPGVTSHSVTLNGLLSCTTYHFRVKSKDSLGNEANGIDATFKTTGCTTGNSTNVGSDSPVSIPVVMVPTDVSVSDNSTTNNLTGFIVRIKITDKAGNALKDAEVTLISSGIMVITDSLGIATFTNVPAGEHRFSVDHPEYELMESTIDVTGNVNGLSATIELTPNSSGVISPREIAIGTVVAIVSVLGVLYFLSKRSGSDNF